MPSIYFEDLEPGYVEECGPYEVTKDEMLSFANQYDPQWFHTDPEKAEESVYGELIASGWHTGSMTMRMLVDDHLTDAAVVGALGVDKLRFPAPVFAGDELFARMEVVETRPSESRPDTGLVRTKVETFDANGEQKMTMEPLVLYERRE